MQLKVNEYDIEIIEQHLKRVQLNYDIEFRFERRYESEIFDLYVSARGKSLHNFDYEELFENLSAIASIEKVKEDTNEANRTIELEIDEAMLGHDWTAGKTELKQIAKFYEEELGKCFPEVKIVVTAITTSWNGAKTVESEIEDLDSFKCARAWEIALERTPAEWWR